MDQWLRRTVLLFPWLVSALVLAIFSTHPVERSCDDSGLTSGDHAYLTSLRLVGGAVALATLVLIWLLARRRRDLRQPGKAGRYTGIDVALALAAVLIVVGLSLGHVLLLVPFLLAGYVSVVFFVSPLAAAGAYVGAIRWSGDSVSNPDAAQRFITRTLIFYWVGLALLIPGVFVLLALRISPICLG
jgi:hypothetical protein